MSQIKSEFIGRSTNQRITEPSGPHVTAAMLKVGQWYIYKKLYKMRQIIAIVGERVTYKDDWGNHGSYDKWSLVRYFPNEATEAEVDFILTNEKRP